ncbi:MAG TPA: hypothetical protein VHB46_03750 [Burkholderiales bacterium]|nr:hypothetical protein [Burkholderiales bacterium]
MIKAGLALVFVAAFTAHAAEQGDGGGTRGDENGTGMYGTFQKRDGAKTPKYLGNAGAETLSAAELMPALGAALEQISKYRRPVGVPEIIRVPHERIEALVCTGKCNALAVYRSGEGIYLDEKLKPETNLFDRSILLHELVHYVQEMNDEHGDMRPCMRWYYREQEAYAIQKVFLGMTGSPTRVGYSAHQSTCDDEPPATKAASEKK